MGWKMETMQKKAAYQYDNDATREECLDYIRHIGMVKDFLRWHNRLRGR